MTRIQSVTAFIPNSFLNNDNKPAERTSSGSSQQHRRGPRSSHCPLRALCKLADRPPIRSTRCPTCPRSRSPPAEGLCPQPSPSPRRCTALPVQDSLLELIGFLFWDPLTPRRHHCCRRKTCSRPTEQRFRVKQMSQLLQNKGFRLLTNIARVMTPTPSHMWLFKRCPKTPRFMSAVIIIMDPRIICHRDAVMYS